jgi:hypothetical protein
LLLYYPFTEVFHNVAIQLTSYMEKTLLPPEVKLIQTSWTGIVRSSLRISTDWYHRFNADHC